MLLKSSHWHHSVKPTSAEIVFPNHAGGYDKAGEAVAHLRGLINLRLSNQASKVKKERNHESIKDSVFNLRGFRICFDARDC